MRDIANQIFVIAKVSMLDPRDLDDLVAVHRWGSLSAAARKRGVAISTISRRLDSLEVALQLSLVDRRANGTQLTRQGEEIARLAEPLSSQIDRIARTAEVLRAGASRLPVRVSATEFVVSEVLAPALADLWAAGVDFPVHLQSQGDVISLAARDADLAIRMSRPEGASLHIRKLPEIALGLFASNAYLAGRDARLLNLKRERLIVYDDSYGRLPELDWIAANGFSEAIAVRTGSTRAQMRAAVEGAGIALLPVSFARRESGLVELPIQHNILSRNPWLIVHRDLKLQPAVRAVHRWIVRAFTVALAPPAR
jgi:DNA-binding transcriptional LysR family regulator